MFSKYKINMRFHRSHYAHCQKCGATHVPMFKISSSQYMIKKHIIFRFRKLVLFIRFGVKQGWQK